MNLGNCKYCYRKIRHRGPQARYCSMDCKRRAEYLRKVLRKQGTASAIPEANPMGIPGSGNTNTDHVHTSVDPNRTRQLELSFVE